MSSYEHRSDFIAYFLQSPITKELEYEIRIKANNKSAAAEYQKLLKKENIQYRQIGLEVFPLPICLLLDLSSLGRALDAWPLGTPAIKKKEASRSRY